MILSVDKDNFKSEVLQSPIPVLVDFWGSRCRSCLELMPDVETLNSDYAGLIKVVKVDASKNRRLCLEPRVMGLPTFLLFEGGNKVKRITGEMDRQMLVELIEEFLDSGRGKQ